MEGTCSDYQMILLPTAFVIQLDQRCYYGRLVRFIAKIKQILILTSRYAVLNLRINPLVTIFGLQGANC